MPISYDLYEPIIGIEVHIQLLTKSKAYSSDKNEYGGLPNSHVSPITLGHPGTLPKPNKKVVEFAIKLGLACGSAITYENIYARKNYFYADLPKGYQITQDKTPICTGGTITIRDKDGKPKDIAITRIHMEEDAGKSIHDQDPTDTLVDLNRAGVPLLEIVTEPVIYNSDEAYNFVNELRKLVRYLEICDGNMEEGSLRCDVNISVKKKDVTKFGERVEIKNMNSMRNVQRAIEHEIIRQTEVYENGGTITQETRGFDAALGTTFSQRVKETANDYRYFPDPDLLPLYVTQEAINAVKATMPLLPNELLVKYTTQLQLSDYDARNIIEDKKIALYFEELITHTTNYKAAANWLMGPIKSYLNELAIEIAHFPILPMKIAEIIQTVENREISFSAASQTLFPALIASPNASIKELATQLNILQEDNQELLQSFIHQAIEKFPAKVAEYKSGKVGLIGLFMGEVMKLSQGKADPQATNVLLKQILEK